MSSFQLANTSFVSAYDSFCREQSWWLSDYALFMACKDANGGICWLDWEAPYRDPSPEEKKALTEKLEKQIGYYQFLQFLFFAEWAQLKTYANEHQIEIIGDIPIFVSLDSSDVWANRHLFQLDEKGYPIDVSGVPPDYFSETGQLWGNPLYAWEVHKKGGYQWWIDRIRHQLTLFDQVRIDHFRGFEAYWAVPYKEETAINGRWLKGPGEDLFHAIQAALGKNLPIIAEDLGVITPEVVDLRDAFYFPGMKVLQFAFESTEENNFLPHQFTDSHCICYTGTHDNDTTVGWFKTLADQPKEKVLRYVNTDGTKISKDFIRLCMGSIAQYAIFPMQDVLSHTSQSRMNTPGTSSGNWGWRYKKGVLNAVLAKELRDLSKLFGRY